VRQTRGSKGQDGLLCHIRAAAEGEPHHDLSWVPHPGGFEGTDGGGTSAIGDAPETTTPPDHLLRADAKDGVDALVREPCLLVKAVLRSARC